MKKLIAQIKSFAGLITAVIVISGTTKFVDWRSTKNQAETRSREFEQVMDTLSVMQDAIWYNNVQITQLDTDVQGIHDTLKKIDAQNQKNNKDIETAIWAINHINDFDPEKLEDIMNEMLKKNYRWNMKPIPLPGVSSIPLSVDTTMDQLNLNLLTNE